MAEKYPEILMDLADRASDLLEHDVGLSRPQAEKLGKRLADRIGLDWAGQQVYIGRNVAISARDSEIFRRFNGTNSAQLAQRYQISVRQVYNIITKVRTAEAIHKKMRGINAKTKTE